MATLTSTLSTGTSHARVAGKALAKTKKEPGFFARFLARMIEARQRRALQELRERHGLRLPTELEDAGLKLGERHEDSLPFVR